MLHGYSVDVIVVSVSKHHDNKVGGASREGKVHVARAEVSTVS